MEHIILLHGINYEEDKALIEDYIRQGGVFLLDEPRTELYQYIDYLHEECGLKAKTLNRLRICREIPFNGNVTLISAEGIELDKPFSMGNLLKHLQPGTRFRIVVENNSRPLLANIVQQLIYISYPLTEIDMKLRSEYKDAAKTALFMEHIQTLHTAAKSAVDRISELCVDPEADEETQTKLYQNRALALASYKKICEQIDKAKDVEMKVAVAASKKTGKSVIVNSMLGVELAPTSLILPTPNTCIYSRSPDSLFHLQMLDESGAPSSMEDFDTVEAIHKRISHEFKIAQANAAAGYACQDMQICYVSNGNNFESYTVYDTPGPDFVAAGCHHDPRKALNECDVAIFAIDYTKHLIPSEEDFLREVKAIFQEKHKFHTLIFVINKIDEALNDKGTKSRIYSIDSIRTKLREIDEQYGDCIVFATSAQDYFYSVELEQTAERLEAFSCLRDPTADLYMSLRPLKDALEEEGYEGQDLIDLLSNLDGEVGRIKSQLGYSKVDMETLRLYSGIPQLMDYVSYVARSKARDEIVNSITYTIAAQCSTLKTLINQITNMEELMGKTQQEIDQISAILNDYLSEVRKILNSNLTEADMKHLDPTNPLTAQITKFQKLSGGDVYPIKLPTVLAEARKDIVHLRESEDMQKGLWGIFRDAYQKKIRGLVGTVVSRTDLGMTAEEVGSVIKKYMEAEIGGRLDNETNFIKGLVEGLQDIVAGRLNRLEVCSDNCQRLLEKNDFHLQLPEPPAFDASIPTPDLSKRITVREDFGMSRKLDGVYEQLNGFRQFFHNIFTHHSFFYSGTDVEVMNELSDDNAEKIKGPFYDMLTDAHIYQAVCGALEELAESVEAAEDDVLRCFQEMNVNCAETIETFKQGIDDRSYYEDKLAEYTRIKTLSDGIQAASKDFLDTWALVLAE